MPTQPSLLKQALNIPFALGVDTKTDKYQVPFGKFQELVNSVFTTRNRLTKRNGFGYLTNPPEDCTNLFTYHQSLIATGAQLNIYSEESEEWLAKGRLHPMTIDVETAVRTSTSQTTVDTATCTNGLSCVTWLDSDGTCYYQIVKAATGDIVVSQVALPATAAMPRAFSLGTYFIVTFTATVTGSPHLRYVAIPVNTPDAPLAVADISTQISGLTAGYDGYVSADKLYVAWNGSDGGGAIRITALAASLTQYATIAVAGETATRVSVVVDESQAYPEMWVTYFDGTDIKTFVYHLVATLSEVLAPTTVVSSVSAVNLTSTVVDQNMTVFYDNDNQYSYASVDSFYMSMNTCDIAGTVGTPSDIIRSVALASKAFYLESTGLNYFVGVYGGAYQPSYFLISDEGEIVAKFAAGNAGGYPINQIIPSVCLNGDNAKVSYLFKDLLVPVNKATQTTSPLNNIYSQFGINLITFTFNTTETSTIEIGGSLIMSGGIVNMYDGVKPVELGFNVWPEDILLTASNGSGSIANDVYYYYVTYEWTDAAGNIHRSAPSIPLYMNMTGADNTVTLDIPTLRLTAKTTTPVRIVIYRWSSSQPIPYQITSITSPLENDTTVDSVQYVDEDPDADILGNPILYTTGGVVENIAPPPANTLSIFKSRAFLINAEDPNSLWYSKQVIENTPVEFSDLFTQFIAPTIGSQGDTGVCKTLAPMDDKLVIGKSTAFYYMIGNGPNNTGADNDFSEPIFITSMVGCSNQKSIALQPNGLMFQSVKGIWLLGRDLSTSYIGDAVEGFNSSEVLSALSIPDTTQIRFILDSGEILMYDYYFQQWGVFKGVAAQTGVLYDSKHTLLGTNFRVYQETPGVYLDGSTPVTMSFITGWINPAGVQGFQRFYELQMLGTYKTPFTLRIGFGFDYSTGRIDDIAISPRDNQYGLYGDDPIYGDGSPYGGPDSPFKARVFPTRQKCSAFQIYFNEYFDRTSGVDPGEGLTMSQLTIVAGMKKGYRTNNQSTSFG